MAVDTLKATTVDKIPNDWLETMLILRTGVKVLQVVERLINAVDKVHAECMCKLLEDEDTGCPHLIFYATLKGWFFGEVAKCHYLICFWNLQR